MALGGLALGIIAIFLPPLPVLWRRGCGAQLLINIGLLFLGWIPGVLHAWYIILNSPNLRQRHRAREVRRRSMSETAYPRRSYEVYRGDSSDRSHHPRPRSTSRRRDVVYDRSSRGAPPPYYPPVEDRYYERRSGYYSSAPAPAGYRY